MEKNKKKVNNKKTNNFDGAKNLTIIIVIWSIGIIVLLAAYALSKTKNYVTNITYNDDKNEMNIYTIDTEGSAVLLESRGNFILMDTGKSDDDNNVINYVSDKISSSKLSGNYKSFSLYITEISDDYIGEVGDLFEKLKVDTLYIQDESILRNIDNNSQKYNNILKKYNNIIDYANNESSEVVALNKESEIVFGDAKIDVLAPLEDIDLTNYLNTSKGLEKYIDDTSLVSMVTVGETNFLTTGNISSDMSEKLAEEYEKNLNAHIYKLSNFEDISSNTTNFFDYVNPDYTINTYENNSASSKVMYYGALYSTDNNGNIEININDDKISTTLEKNKIKLKVFYKNEDNELLSKETYYLSKGNMLTENWDLFVRNFEGYENYKIDYGFELKNITSSIYDKATFKGISNLDKNIDITVLYKKVLPKSISLNNENLSLNIGEETELVPIIEPENSFVNDLIWESDNEKVATVKNGVVVGESKGQAIITVGIKGSSVKTTCVVNVGEFDQSITDINLKTKNLIIDKNVNFDLNHFENENIEWSVANTDILEISNDGIIKPLKKGVTVITANLNGYTDSCKVTITDGLIISNIKGDTSVEELFNDLGLKDATVLGSYGKFKNNDEIVFTDDSLIVKKDKTLSVYLISVIGDVNGEGQVDKDDLVILDEYLSGKRKLNKAALKAADVNNDGKINIKDKNILNNYIKHKTGYESLPYTK